LTEAQWAPTSRSASPRSAAATIRTGIVIERVFYRRLTREGGGISFAGMGIIIAGFGISMVLQNVELRQARPHRSLVAAANLKAGASAERGAK
jgi:branched-subunit amino acid ABC-type transport system permease component